MIPSNAFTPEPDTGIIYTVNNLPYDPLTQVVRGGNAIGDYTKSRNFQNWVVYYENDTIKIRPEISNTAVFTLSAVGVITLSLAFDTAMNPVLTWTNASGASLHYYDSISLSFITEDYPLVTSSRVCVDKIEDFYDSDSDIMFVYTRAGVVYYRQQRDRYTIERAIKTLHGYVKKVGNSNKNRLQIEVSMLPVDIPSQPLVVVSPDYAHDGDTIDYTVNTGLMQNGTVLNYVFSTGETGSITIQNSTATVTSVLPMDYQAGDKQLSVSFYIPGILTPILTSSVITVKDIN